MVVFSLTLVRHGETLYNRKKILQGQTDVPLSQLGLQQAKLAAARLENENFTHVFTSDLSRASQTAQVIMDGSKACHCAIMRDKRLRERKFGALEGKSHKDLHAAAKLANTPVGSYTPPGAETNQQMHDRALSFFRDLCKLLVAFVNEGEEAEYIPGSIKQRHGGSLGRNSGHIKNRMFSSRRSQSFCGISSMSDSSDLDIYSDIHSSSSDQKKRKYDVEDHGSHTIADNEKRKTKNSTEIITRNSPKHKGCPQYSNGKLEPSDNLEEGSALVTPEGTVVDTFIGRSNSSSSSGYSSLPDSTDLTDKDSTEDHCKQVGDKNGSSDSLFSNSLPSAVVGKHASGGYCPNVSLSPLLAHRLSSVSSISSGRNSSFDDMDGLPPATADVLVVSHGGLIKELIRHFADNLGCKIPGGKNHVCANCSLSKFVFTVHDLNDTPSVSCLLINDKDHLQDMEVLELDGVL